MITAGRTARALDVRPGFEKRSGQTTAKSSQNTNRSRWRRWLYYCAAEDIDPLFSPATVVAAWAEVLAHELDKRFGGKNQNGTHAAEQYVSTVSETLRLAFAIAVRSSPAVLDAMKALSKTLPKTKPCLPDAVDVRRLSDYVCSRPDNWDLPLEELRAKALALIARRAGR